MWPLFQINKLPADYKHVNHSKQGCVCSDRTHHSRRGCPEADRHEITCSTQGSWTPSEHSSWSFAPRAWTCLQQQNGALEASPHHLKTSSFPQTQCNAADEIWSVTPISSAPVPCTRSSDCNASYLPLIEALPRCCDDWTLHILSRRKTSCDIDSSSCEVSILSQSFLLMTFEVWSCVTVRAGSCIYVVLKVTAGQFCSRRVKCRGRSRCIPQCRVFFYWAIVWRQQMCIVCL